jgi:hypothetical protein
MDDLRGMLNQLGDAHGESAAGPAPVGAGCQEGTGMPDLGGLLGGLLGGSEEP